MGYERQSPDYTQLVEHIAAKYPREWDLADKEKYGDRTTDFIRRFAYEANKIDFRIGLNGKRGNPNDLSKDAIAYKNNTVPAALGGCEVIDIMVGNGHKPAWQDVTLPNVAGAWVQPTDPDNIIDNNPTNPNPGTGDLQNQIDELKRLMEQFIKIGDQITLRSLEWADYPAKFVCCDHNQGNRLIANRDEGTGPWEKLTIGRED